MAISEPQKVPKAKISSVDVVSFNGGIDQRGDHNITPNCFTGRNVRVTPQGLATFRHVLKRWQPDLVGTVFEVFPALYDGDLYYITADDGKIKYKKRADNSWSVAGGDNVVTTDNVLADGTPNPDPSVRNTFVRVLDRVLILNGEDNFGYFDLGTKEVSHATKVDDPTTAPTATASGITTTGSFKVYYAVSFNSLIGETAISPILTQEVSKSRDRWSADGDEYLTLTRAGSSPNGATSWNLYISLAPEGGAIAPSDMLPLALGLGLDQTTFIDNGSIAVILSEGVAPTINSTEGPRAKYGIESQGRPFLYGVKNDEYAIYIGGIGEKATNFGLSAGGYRHVLNEGTNYYPVSLVGFRNGQGIPSLTVLYSNTQGLSKQAIIEQQTVSYGDTSMVVWTTTEQNYGTAGVFSPYGIVNYRGGLYSPSTDGFSKFDTQASLQNVLSNTRISDPIAGEVDTIKVNKSKNIVGTAWRNCVIWAVPARGFNYNNELLFYDISNKDLACWYTSDVKAQWIGVISPDNAPAFVYLCQGNHLFVLEDGCVALDQTSDGLVQGFPFEIRTGVIGFNTAHANYYAIVQAVFYLLDFIGTATLSVTYRDRSNTLRTKTRTVTRGSYMQTISGGWGSDDYLYNEELPSTVLGWDDIARIIDDVQAVGKSNIRVRIPLNAVTNEVQASVAFDPDGSGLIVRSISLEGQSLGVSPDIR